ncbi:MAG: amidohydrolase family protein [Deltaproteobacteria bacterium]|nr:amidohydrolase family protein [Deltaproteobacteria bacterium]
MLLKARWLLPVNSPPLPDAAIRIEGESIQKIVSRQEITNEEKIIDLSDFVLLPGFVNAHAHLEFSRVPKQKNFTEWVRQVIALQASATEADKRKMIRSTAKSLATTGTTTAAIHAGLDLPVDCLSSLPFKTITFLEILGLTEEIALANIRKAFDGRVRALIEKDSEIYPSPHSLYGLGEEFLDKLLETSDSLLSIHLLESEDEEQFFRKRTGPLAELIAERGGKLPFPARSPIEWLASHRALSNRLLVVHGNYLTETEIELLQKGGSSVIHCPGSHRYFGHRDFPLAELQNSGVNVALGTDSLASNEGLSMLAEMRNFRTKSGLSRNEILKMATLNGAIALSKEKEIGSLEVGKKADIIGVPIGRHKDPLDAVFEATEVSFIMRDGKICFAP